MNGGTVLVACGGKSLERRISLASGQRAAASLRELGLPARTRDVDAEFLGELRREPPRFVFNAMHGHGGEDGTLQDLLEILRVPYTGSDVHASALCLDKHAFKGMCVARGIPTAPWHSFSRSAFTDYGAGEVLGDLLEQMGLPLVVKPSRQGSSMGLHLVQREEELLPAVIGALSYDDRVIVEQFVRGREIAVTVLGPAEQPNALPPVEIESEDPFYTYAAHYEMGAARLVAANLGELRERVDDVARAAYSAAGCRDLARVDIILDEQHVPQVLEINTVPGLTETGPTPIAHALADMTFTDLVSQVIERVLALSA